MHRRAKGPDHSEQRQLDFCTARLRENPQRTNAELERLVKAEFGVVVNRSLLADARDMVKGTSPEPKTPKQRYLVALFSLNATLPTLEAIAAGKRCFGEYTFPRAVERWRRSAIVHPMPEVEAQTVVKETEAHTVTGLRTFQL